MLSQRCPVPMIGGLLRAGRRTAFSLLLLLGLAACAPPDRIGFLGGLSGRVTDLGISGLYGASLAVEQRNASGGVNGRRIELIAEDDHQHPETARRAFQRLAEKNVVAIIGPMTSVVAQAVLPLADERRLPLISPTVTTAQLSGRDDYFLRITPSTTEFAATTARHLVRERQIRRIRPVFDLANAAYSKGWLRDFASIVEAEGGTLLEPITFIADDTIDFGALARRALAERPEAVVLIASALDTAMLCESLRKRHQTLPIAASEWAGSERLIELGGRWVEDLLVPQVFDRDSPVDNYKTFRQAFFMRYASDPGVAGTHAYDATNVVLDTLAAGAPQRSLKHLILGHRKFSGRQREIVFDANGDNIGTAALMIIRNGQYMLASEAR